MIFNLSDEKLYIERVTYTVMDALSKTGGWMGIVLGLFQILMFAIEDVVMYSDFIAKLYKSQSLTAVKKAPQL
jgi:hypothetical protein